MHKRIWELDAFRGLCIICMFAVHLLFDLVYFVGLNITFPDWYTAVQQYGGTLFVLLSGCCATLGSRSFRRGLIVLGAGLLVSLVTALMYRLGMADRTVVVWFGVLHLLGVCMMLYPLEKKLPTPALLAQAVVIIAVGMLFVHTRVQTDVLFPFGLYSPDFFSGDYFPIFPQLGWFLLGVCFGRTVYRDKTTRLPGRFQTTAPAKILCLIGRNSLPVYLLHQPVIYGVIELIMLLK